MRRLATLFLATILVLITLVGARRMTEGAQEATPPPDCPGASQPPDGVTAVPIIYGPTSAAPDYELWLYRVTINAGSSIPMMCYPEAMTVVVLEGTLSLTRDQTGDEPVFFTRAGAESIPQPMECDFESPEAATCELPRGEQISLAAGDTVFHESASYSYEAIGGDAMLSVSVLKLHYPSDEPPGGAGADFGWLECCSGPKNPPMIPPPGTPVAGTPIP